MQLIIGNKNYSSWSLRAWLLLSHHKIPFEEVRIPLDQEDTHARLTRYSDAGKVPVLLDGELTIWDSLAICEYVSENYLEGRGWPAEVGARAEARSCSAEMHSGFQQVRGQLPMNCRATARHVAGNAALEKEIARVDRIWSNCRQTHVSRGPWLFGQFSIADCMFAPVVSRFSTYGIKMSPEAAQYMECVLDDEHMREWLRQARAESEILDAEEVGA
ncbi:glutathione S-transferase family protein [Pseudohongiella sp.]|uniref:GST N-terminal domain-containing protein n=1 Tax=marine sediment metagenome TaxID=412755 RepID=A0A0F9W0S8_9ZZZZ|nr:glutathione S-transferase family protein [Pseudohongiella sp.]HDZ08314.1 glutathione S-transferase family protein [Pseudohongiella sp.]HEA62590.1 glutathione S-transferase family protein [Pseudohongiella sp.]